jgi:diaminopimelate decarboxylase
VGDKYSKFGVPLRENENRIVDCYNKYEWLNGIHYHIGSQGNTLEQLVSPACEVINLLKKIQRSLSWIDIGGGLPVNYSENDHAPSYADYYNLLQRNCPSLLSGSYKIITEFGRSIHANAGWTASRVEYVKKYSGTITVIIHVGADLFMRRIYHPEHWHHDLSVVDKNGHIKSGPKQKVTIAGPLCFNGDIITRDIELPVIEEGDYIIIHDSGGYTLSLWSRHTSRLLPRVLGYTNNGVNFKLLKNEETLDDLYTFWS